MEPLSVSLTRLFYNEPPNADFAWMGECHAANFERAEMLRCLAAGGDPKAQGIAEHGELLGGPDKARRTLYGGIKHPRHFGFCGGLAPMEWFAHEDAQRTGQADPDHKFLVLMIASCTAGAESRPTAAEVYESIVTNGDISDDAAGDLKHMLGCMFEDDLPGLLEDEGLSVNQVARAFHRSHCRRHSHMDWINGFAVPLDEDAVALRMLRRRAESAPIGPPSLLYDPDAGWEDDGGGRDPSPWFQRRLSTAVGSAGADRRPWFWIAGQVLADMADLCPVPMREALVAWDDRLRDDDVSLLAAWRTRLRDGGPKLSRLLRGMDPDSDRLLPHMPLAGVLSGPERHALREACGRREWWAKMGDKKTAAGSLGRDANTWRASGTKASGRRSSGSSRPRASPHPWRQ